MIGNLGQGGKRQVRSPGFSRHPNFRLKITIGRSIHLRLQWGMMKWCSKRLLSGDYFRTSGDNVTSKCIVLAIGLSFCTPFVALAAAPEYAADLVANVTYVERDGKPLLADVMIPKAEGTTISKFPAVLLIHGGAWRAGNKTHLRFVGKMLAEHGYVAVMINYRLAPKHKFPAQYDDCQAALEWMRTNADRYQIDPNWIAAWGYSAGGHLSALLATRLSSTEPANDATTTAHTSTTSTALKGLQAFVAGGAPCDFRSIPPNVDFLSFWLGGTRTAAPEMYIAASPRQFVSKHTPPGFFFHGEDDTLVNIRDPKALVADLEKLHTSVEMHVIPKTGHILAMFDVKAVQGGIAFLDKARNAKIVVADQP